MAPSSSPVARHGRLQVRGNQILGLHFEGFGLGFGVWGLGLRGLGFRGFGVQGLGLRV